MAREPYDPRKHGISYTTIADWMDCRQKGRFWVEGVYPIAPSYPLTFGTVIHECLGSIHQAIAQGRCTKLPGRKRIRRVVAAAEEAWHKENRRASKKAIEQLELACALAEQMLPQYFRFWKKTLFTMEWDDKLTERFHKIPFKVTGHDEVMLNVKMDSAFFLRKIIRSRKKGTKKKVRRLWLFETKTSSKIVPESLAETLPIGLQHGIYAIGLEHLYGKLPRGTIYNFIRRPGLYRRKDEDFRDYAERCGEDVAKRPEFYFIRIPIVTDKDEVSLVRAELQGIILDYLKWLDQIRKHPTGALVHYRRTGACDGKFGPCPFIPICTRNDYTMFKGGPKRV